MKLLDRVLMLAPHRDDECLSAGGTLLQCKDLYIHYHNDTHPSVEVGSYAIEADLVRKALGCSVSYSMYNDVNRLAEHPLACLITELEDLINFYKPTTVIIPARSYNQDHRIVYAAAMTALRVHDKNHYVANILLAEQPETSTPPYSQFIPHLYIPINISAKMELYKLYRSQQRAHRSLDHIRALATFRGMQCNEESAEAFQIVRMTENV